MFKKESYFSRINCKLITWKTKDCLLNTFFKFLIGFAQCKDFVNGFQGSVIISFLIEDLNEKFNFF